MRFLWDTWHFNYTPGLMHNQIKIFLSWHKLFYKLNSVHGNHLKNLASENTQNQTKRANNTLSPLFSTCHYHIGLNMVENAFVSDFRWKNFLNMSWYHKKKNTQNRRVLFLVANPNGYEAYTLQVLEGRLCYWEQMLRL